jgi:hypothetical protein
MNFFTKFIKPTPPAERPLRVAYQYGRPGSDVVVGESFNFDIANTIAAKKGYWISAVQKEQP